MTVVLLGRRAQHLYMVVCLEHILLVRGAGMGMSSPLQTLSEKTWARIWFALVMLCNTHLEFAKDPSHPLSRHSGPYQVSHSASALSPACRGTVNCLRHPCRPPAGLRSSQSRLYHQLLPIGSGVGREAGWLGS